MHDHFVHNDMRKECATKPVLFSVGRWHSALGFDPVYRRNISQRR